jgi:hypothetical protein
MKLKQIANLHGSKLLNRPSLHTQHLYDANAAVDSGSRAAGDTNLASGIPTKERHRKYFGIKTQGNQL